MSASGRAPRMSASWVGDLAAVERVELQPPHAPAAPQLGEQRAHRVAAVQLVGAVGDHGQQPALVRQAGGEEGEEAAGRVVGPVGVVEPEDHRRVLGQRFEQAEQRLEGAVAILVGFAPAARSRSSSGTSAPSPARVAGERRVEDRVAFAQQAAQRRDQRRVGQLVAAELDALAADRAAAPFGRPRR